MKRIRPDVAGIISGTVLAGAAALWMLERYGVMPAEHLNLGVALLLVLAGIVGLVASNRG
jgi:hypothetical protein